MNSFTLLATSDWILDLSKSFDRESKLHYRIDRMRCKVLGFVTRICSELKLLTPIKSYYIVHYSSQF